MTGKRLKKKMGVKKKEEVMEALLKKFVASVGRISGKELEKLEISQLRKLVISKERKQVIRLWVDGSGEGDKLFNALVRMGYNVDRLLSGCEEPFVIVKNGSYYQGYSEIINIFGLSYFYRNL